MIDIIVRIIRKLIVNPNKKAPIYAIMIIFIVPFIILFVYLGILTMGSKRQMLDNNYNGRQNLLAKENRRGDIIAKDGEILASTILNSDGDEVRYYPYNNMFAHVVGHSNRGKTGIESYANYYLLSANLPLSVRAKNDELGIKNQGDSIYTTLSVPMQKIAYDSLGVYRGAIIVTEVETGKILAMVSKPDYDPNTIIEDWDKYIDDKDKSVLLNRATQGLYHPGSTFKTVTSLEYIRENNEDIQDYSYNCSGIYKSANSSIRCYHSTAHGSVNYWESYAKSCNASFANIGLSLDRESFKKTLDNLGFNKNINIELPVSVDNIRIDDIEDDDKMLQISIGQGEAIITPIHLHMITTAIANDGIAKAPYIIDKIVNGAGEYVEYINAGNDINMMSVSEASILKELMAEVIQNGTGRKLKDLSYTVGGKTGSAEHNHDELDSHAWFTAFAPVDDPKVAVTILVEDIGTGGDYAVPIAKRLLDYYFGVY